VRAITDDSEIRGAAPDLFAFVLLPLYNNAGKVPAWGSRQSCFRETSRNVPDIARIDPRRLHANERFSLARLGDRNFFDS
jgi:hypothetical protein